MRGNWKGKKKREAGTEGGVNSGGIGRIKRRIDATVGSVGIRRETLRVRAGSVRPYIIASNCRLVCVGKYIGLAFRNRSRLRTFDWERRLGFSLDSRWILGPRGRFGRARRDARLSIFLLAWMDFLATKRTVAAAPAGQWNALGGTRESSRWQFVRVVAIHPRFHRFPVTMYNIAWSAARERATGRTIGLPIGGPTTVLTRR